MNSNQNHLEVLKDKKKIFNEGISIFYDLFQLALLIRLASQVVRIPNPTLETNIDSLCLGGSKFNSLENLEAVYNKYKNKQMIIHDLVNQ